VNFTLYKCSVYYSGFQWFLSISPNGLELGTNKDTDFYYSIDDKDNLVIDFPPRKFRALQQSFEPAPNIDRSFMIIHHTGIITICTG
jgi:hypothetical protein